MSIRKAIFTVLWWTGDVGRVHNETTGYVEITGNNLNCRDLVYKEKVEGALNTETNEFLLRPIGRNSQACMCDSDDCCVSANCSRPVTHRIVTKGRKHKNFCGFCFLWRQRKGLI